MKPEGWDACYTTALASLEKLRAYCGPSRSNAFLLSARVLIEAANEDFDAGEPPQADEERVLGDTAPDRQRAGAAAPRSDPAQKPPTPEASAPAARPPSPSSAPPAELLKRLADRCQEVFTVKGDRGKPVPSNGLVREWFRCEFPGFVPGVPIARQLTADDVAEVLDVLQVPAEAKNDKLQEARYDYRKVRAELELVGLTTYGITTGLTVEVLRRWTAGGKKALEARKEPERA